MEPETRNEKTEHHPWCNYFGRAREGCKMCRELYEKYPISADESPSDLQKKHFPNAVRRNDRT